ncbi:MAG: glycosyltransferase [Eubacteriales bacterium]|nr:glycosyltransferase [Eubacteriales bacterium]
MKKSLILSTYNGNKYIFQMLESIRNQTIEFDEVLISDDCSTDDTYSIVSNYIDRYRLNWINKKNEHNKGWRQNFVDLLMSTTGDIIFFADQDDYWLKNKVEVMVDIVKKKKEILLLASDICKFKEDEWINNHKEDSIPTGEINIYQPQIEKTIMNISKPGCTYCVRGEIRELVEKYYVDGLPHDAFCWRIALLLNRLYLMNEYSIYYRVHSNNASKRKKPSCQLRIDDLEYYKLVFDSCNKLTSSEGLKCAEKTINRLKKYIDLRSGLIINRKLLNALPLIGYRDYYYSWGSYVNDILISITQK